MHQDTKVLCAYLLFFLPTGIMLKAPHFVHKGTPFSLVDTTPETLNYVENEFQLLDDDVVTLTFPKSGTHWMIEILSLIQQNGDPTWVHNIDTYQRSPWIETNYSLKTALNNPPPRLLTTHLPVHLFPKSFFRSKAKIIYMLRNPKDVLISVYYFSKIFKSLKAPEDLQELHDAFLSGNVNYGSWFTHTKGWLEMKGRANFFIITYEELQKDIRGSVERICHFLGKELTRQEMDLVVENASLQSMRENKMSNMSQAPNTMMDHSKGVLLRKGICEDWKNHLTVAQNEQFDRVYQEQMKDVTMTFPWE